MKPICLKKIIGFTLSLSLMICVIPIYPNNLIGVGTVSAESTISNPVCGEETVWDCIYYGMYPQREIVKYLDEYSAIDSSVLSKKNDVIEDSGLYEQVVTAAWFSVGDYVKTTLDDGSSYTKIYQKEIVGSGTSGEYWKYYKWAADPNSINIYDYHYFKFEPIKWRVLEVDNNKALLLSDIALDDFAYSRETERSSGPGITWETSEMRSWLNGYNHTQSYPSINYTGKGFINKAFNSEEQNAIEVTNVEVNRGNNTQDKVFLLSSDDVAGTEKAVSHGFSRVIKEADRARQSNSSGYAKARGTASYVDTNAIATCEWPLRTNSDSFLYNVDYIMVDGIHNAGASMKTANWGIRPAIVLDLSKTDLWSYAGKVTSTGKISLEGRAISEIEESYYYTGKEICPEITIDGLLKDTDYTVDYSNNTDPGKATITIQGIGDYFGTIENSFQIKKHETVHHSAVKATCTDGGNLEYWTCNDCDKLFLDADGLQETTLKSVFTNSLGHDYQEVVVDPTCTVNGYTSHICSRCGEKYDDTETPANGHHFGDWKTVSSPKCEDVGSEKRVCSECGFEEFKDINATGHTFDDAYTVDQQPTCTDDGSMSKHCINCEVKDDVQVIHALGHTWKHYKKTAGLLKNGTEYDYCTVCNTKENVKTLAGYATYYVKSFKVAKAKKAFTAKWTKQSVANQKKFNGYQIRYSLKSNMSGAKYATAARSSKSKKVSKLKAKKTYYVQVRTYTESGGKTFYSKWSAKKSVKTK